MKQKADLTKALKRAKRKIRFFKIKLFFLITLPVAVITIGQAVIREYSKVKIRQAAGAVSPKNLSDSKMSAPDRTSQEIF